MADISSYIRLIELASRGEDVRDAIINALNSINQGAFGEFDDVPTAGSGKAVTSGAIKTALDGKQDLLTFDNAPTQGSDNPVKSGGIYSAIEAMQGALQFDDTPTEGAPIPSHQVVFTMRSKVWRSPWMIRPQREATMPLSPAASKRRLTQNRIRFSTIQRQRRTAANW